METFTSCIPEKGKPSEFKAPKKIEELLEEDGVFPKITENQ